MVKITNGVNVYVVSDGAYNDIYRHQGYQVIGDSEAKDFEPENNESAKTADEIFIEELQEKPISQWNKDEVKRYAVIKDIDIKGTKSINDAKEVIKVAMAAESEE